MGETARRFEVSARALEPIAQCHVVNNKYHQRIGSKKGLKVASLNVNGLRFHSDELELLMNNLDIDILALNETKLDSSMHQQITEISGYSQQRLDRSCFGGGVSMYVRNSIIYTSRYDIPHENLEMLCIDVLLPKCRPFFIVFWYRPPSSPVDLFYKAEKVLSYLDKEGKEIILKPWPNALDFSLYNARHAC